MSENTDQLAVLEPAPAPTAPASAGPSVKRAPRFAGQIPGEPGTWVFILGDMTVFALLFGVFVYYRGKQPHIFAHSQKELHRYFGATSGDVFGSGDAGATWTTVATRLPPVYSIAAV